MVIGSLRVFRVFARLAPPSVFSHSRCSVFAVRRPKLMCDRAHYLYWGWNAFNLYTLLCVHLGYFKVGRAIDVFRHLLLVIINRHRTCSSLVPQPLHTPRYSLWRCNVLATYFRISCVAKFAWSSRNIRIFVRGPDGSPSYFPYTTSYGCVLVDRTQT